VAETPEMMRLKQLTEQQSQVRNKTKAIEINKSFDANRFVQNKFFLNCLRMYLF
jgi:DNA-binding protein